MAKQWVDITTIDNITPFMKVRWKSSMSIPGGDAWFAEAPGLTTDGMGWTAGDKNNGWFSAHRMNSNSYSACFDFDHTQSGYWDAPSSTFRLSVKDVSRSGNGFYDSAVTVSGDTYYEVDFSLWVGASGYQLYWPYSGTPVSVGDILVEIESGPIKLDKDSVSFRASGGTESVTVTADDDWTAVASDAWITVSALSGASGTTTITVTAPDYTGTVARGGSVTFTCSGETVVLTVGQNKAPGGFGGGAYLGATAIEGMCLGSSALSAVYIGENMVFPKEINTVIRYTAPAQVVPNVAYSDSAWTLTLSSDTYDSTTSAGTVTFSGTGLTIPDGAFSATTIESVVISKGAVSMGNEVFANCANLASYKFPRTLTSIGLGTFAYGCTALTEGIILDQVTSLSSSTFYNASGLISASLPSGMTSLPEWTFNGCSSLTGFTIPEGVTEIKDRAFQDTSSLSAITIPSGVTDIATYAFNNSGLQEITFKGITPPTVHSSSLNVANTSGTVYCPSSALSAYQSWIAGLTGQNISGWTVTGQGLPSVPFLINFNAKRYSNGSIPQEDGAYVTLPLTINNVVFHSDYLSFIGTAQTVFNFGSDASNPFNITPSDLGLTIIAKTGRGATTSGNLISNRGLNGTTKLNWMYRPAKSDNTSMFHTMDGGWDGNGYTLSAYPNIYAFRINPSDSNNGQYNSYTDNTSAATGQVSCQNTQSDKIVFFNGYPDSKTEHFTGDFYWIYVARTYLTDAEVQQVINYNENL